MAVFSGVGVALVTLFGDDGDVDAAATAEHAVALVEAGVRAVVPVLAGTGGPSPRQAVALTAAAVDHGADAVLVLSPPGAADVRPYYDAVAKAAGATPVLAYHYPAVSPPGIRVAALSDLPIAGCKDSTGDPDRLLEELTDWGGPLYVGSSAVVSYAGALGCEGAILALANAEPERCVRAFAGDAAAQLELAGPHAFARGRFPAGIKELTARRFGTSTVARMG
jgi:4-hydroxy-tetrahydrodipicolinate synthase